MKQDRHDDGKRPSTFPEQQWYDEQIKDQSAVDEQVDAPFVLEILSDDREAWLFGQP